MHKQPEVTDATREAFIDAFCTLAVEKPISDITIKEITDLSGYNRTTFYRYFNSVYTLLDYLENFWIRGFVNTVMTDGATLVMDSAFLHDMFDYIREHGDRIRMLSDENIRADFLVKLQKYLIQNTDISVSEHSKTATDIYFSAVAATVTSFLDNNSSLTEEDCISILERLYSRWYVKEIETDIDNSSYEPEFAYLNQ